MNAIEKIEKRKIGYEPLLLETKPVDPEVHEYKNKLTDYGIRNKTVKVIEDKLVEKNKSKEEVVKKQAINILIEAFAPFNIVTYKTLNDVCNDHKLVIASISHYDKAVPDENVEDIDSFVTKLKSIDKSILNKLQVTKNKYFTFDERGKCKSVFIPKSKYQHVYDDNVVGTEEMFKVAAPIDHFDLPKTSLKIGNEFGKGMENVKFKYKFELYKPKFELDPIVFIPIHFLDEVFCIIVTAWDKVADDSRILSKL